MRINDARLVALWRRVFASFAEHGVGDSLFALSDGLQGRLLGRDALGRQLRDHLLQRLGIGGHPFPELGHLFGRWGIGRKIRSREAEIAGHAPHQDISIRQGQVCSARAVASANVPASFE